MEYIWSSKIMSVRTRTSRGETSQIYLLRNRGSRNRKERRPEKQRKGKLLGAGSVAKVYQFPLIVNYASTNHKIQVTVAF